MDTEKYKTIWTVTIVWQMFYLLIAVIIVLSGLEPIYDERKLPMDTWMIMLIFSLISFIIIFLISKLQKLNFKNIKINIENNKIKKMDDVYSVYYIYSTLWVHLINIINIAGILYFLFFGNFLILGIAIVMTLLGIYMIGPKKNHFEQYIHFFNENIQK